MTSQRTKKRRLRHEPEKKYVNESQQKSVVITDEFDKIDLMSKSDLLMRCWNIGDRLMLEKGQGDPVRCMAAIYFFIEFDEPLPEELKRWFLDGLHKHRELNGGKTLDKIYKLSGEETKRRPYTEQDSLKTKLTEQLIELLTISNLNIAQASRLVIWRNQITSIKPTTLQGYHRKRKREGTIRMESLFDNENREVDLHRIENYKRARAKYGLNGVREEYKRLMAVYNFIESTSESEYRELISTKKPIEYLPR